MNEHTQLVAAVCILQDMSARDLANRCLEAETRALEYEHKADEWNDKYIASQREVDAAMAVLGTVMTVIGGRDLLTAVECARTELLRLRESQSGRKDFIR